MLTKLRNQFGKIAYAERCRRDNRRVLARFESLDPSGTVAQEIHHVLEPHYREYQEIVSSGAAPASLITSALLYGLARATRPRRVVDFGSGFSSFVLRAYQSRHDHSVEVWSVDSDPGWLDRTRDYLRHERLPVDHLLSWTEYRQHAPPRFDLVFLDISPSSRRYQELEHFLGLLNPGGLLLIDDLHKRTLRGPILSKLAGLPYTTYNLRRLTLDDYGRYALLVADDRHTTSAR